MCLFVSPDCLPTSSLQLSRTQPRDVPLTGCTLLECIPMPHKSLCLARSLSKGTWGLTQPTHISQTGTCSLRTCYHPKASQVTASAHGMGHLHNEGEDINRTPRPLQVTLSGLSPRITLESRWRAESSEQPDPSIEDFKSHQR